MASFRDILRLNARPRLAVDFGADFVAVRHAPEGGEWTELGAAPLDAADFADQLIALAAVAGDVTGGDMRAELWLPASQIINLHIEESPWLEFSARRHAALRLTEAVDMPEDQLRYDLSALGSGRRRAACATEATTVEEACAYAAGWGFDPVIVTTRHAAAAFTRPPRFDGAASRRAAAPIAAAGAVALALMIGGGALIGLQDGPYEPPAVNLETVATAPSPVREPASDESASAQGVRDGSPPPTELAQADAARTEAPVLVDLDEPKGAETPLDFRISAGAAPLSPPELEAALSLPHIARPESAATEVGPAATIAPLTLDLDLARKISVDQTPASPPPPEPQAALAPDIAEADDARAPQTANTTDPVKAAEEAEEWVEAEVDAETEAGAEAPPPADADATVAAQAAAPSPGPERAGDAVAQAGDGEVQPDENAPLVSDPDRVFGDADPSEVAILAPSAPIRRSTAPLALPESDDFDEIDLGPGPGSVLTAPAPGHRPAALDMTPSDLAVLTAPSPGRRPASIKPRPKPVVAGTRTARAPSRGKPSGPGLARAATLVDVIPLDDLSLLGTFGQGNGRRALLRMPTGEVVRVSRGDVVQGWVIGRIEALSMRITRGGEARTLPLAR